MDTLHSTQRGAVTWITLHRPKAGNTLNPQMASELLQALRTASDAPQVRCVVLTGTGPHFCMGGDVRYMHTALQESAAQRDQQMASLITQFGQIVLQMQAMEKPLIAAVRGAVAGGGVSLMNACDLAIASDTAFFKFAYSQLGTSPDGGGSYSLARLLGLRKALELALLDERLDAQSALACGLVNRVVSDAVLEDSAQAIAERLAQQATQALGRTKRLLHAAFDQTLAQQVEDELAQFLKNMTGHDFPEAVTAFLEKRPAQFNGQ